MICVTERSRGKKASAYHHGDLRQALIDAALAMIEERDVASVSLRAVARRVGVTYAAPYHHFEDKRALLAAVAEEGFRELGALMQRAVAETEGRSRRDQFHQLGLSYVQFALSHPAHFRVMCGPDLKEKEAYPELHAAAQACFDRLMETTARALDDPSDATAVMSLAVTAWSAVHGLAMLWIDGPLAEKFEGVPIERLVESITATLFPS